MGENSDNTASRREVLGTAPIGGLMFKFAVPSIIAMLVSALYNIVDQIFIGQAVGTLGNAATNIAFPLVCTEMPSSIAFLIALTKSFPEASSSKEK